MLNLYTKLIIPYSRYCLRVFARMIPLSLFYGEKIFNNTRLNRKSNISKSKIKQETGRQ